jgi:hypothetical protein
LQFNNEEVIKMFTIKTALILAIIALAVYIVKSIPQILLWIAGLGGVTRLRKWTDTLATDAGHIDATVRYGPGEGSAQDKS